MAKASSTLQSAQSPVPVPATSTHYRPKDYFGRYDLQTHLMITVKGTARRNALRKALDNGQINTVPEAIKGAALSKDVRTLTGSLHPSLMGGEYLPTAQVAEVEIARIRIDSTTGDVTCLYARIVGQRFAYRVVDEYQGDTLGSRARRTSNLPLTMGQLVDFFLGAWDLYVCLECNFEDDPEGMLGFFEGESEFYPYFDAELRRRVREKFAPALQDD